MKRLVVFKDLYPETKKGQMLIYTVFGGKCWIKYVAVTELLADIYKITKGKKINLITSCYTSVKPHFRLFCSQI